MNSGSSVGETTVSDEHLVQRSREGERLAFEALCARIEGPLFGYALGMIHDRHEAEDIAQESLLRLYRIASTGQLRDGGGSARALAFTIAHNLAVDRLRRERHTQPLDENTPAPENRPAEQVLLREQLDKALAELPESHRSALMLREFGGLAYAEIASALDANLGEVKVWIYRARKRLAMLLDRDGQYVGDVTGGM